MKSIIISENKSLKLKNVLSNCINLSEGNAHMMDIEVDKMKIFIKTHGGEQIGPLIQHSYLEANNDGSANIMIEFMLQSEQFINDVESPYKMEKIYRVSNCLYARYIGPEETIKFAYDKLGVYAFENEIDLKGNSYTIYVDRNQDDECIVADVFMPLKDN